MTDPIPAELSARKPEFMVALIWVAFVGASVVLLIDWKLKQDILNMITAFDQRMESDRESPITGARFYPDFDESPLLGVYDDAVAATTATAATANKRRTRNAATNGKPGTPEDHERVPAGTVGVAGVSDDQGGK